MKPSLSLPCWIVAAIAAGAVLTPPVSYADGVAANPYAVGTGSTPLSAQEIGALMQYIQQSKMQLEEAKRQAQGKSPAEAYLILSGAAKQVVLGSAYAEPYRELIMRLVLNQALELVEGVPTPDGAGQASPPILGGSVSTTLKARILSESIDLALQYVVNDEAQIQNAQINPQAYQRVASQRVGLAMQWARSVLNGPAQLRMYVSILQHWVNTLAGLEQTAISSQAEPLLRAHAALQIASSGMSNPSMHPAIRSRVVGVIRSVQETSPQRQDELRAQAEAEHRQAEERRLEEERRREAERPLPGSQFVSIQPGTFMFGSPASELNRSSDEFYRSVTIRDGFEMQTTEVTQAQWVAVLGFNPSTFKNREHCPDTHQSQPVAMCPTHPVESMEYSDAERFLSTLNARAQSEGYVYRLPSEVEWEYAARAGTTTAYSFGDDGSQLSSYAWYAGNSGDQTHAVAGLGANPWGLYDMHGNVWELTSDLYGMRTDNPAIYEYSERNRAIRGGGFADIYLERSTGYGGQALRSAHHGQFHVFAFFFSKAVGLRLVRTRAQN